MRYLLMTPQTELKRLKRIYGFMNIISLYDHGDQERANSPELEGKSIEMPPLWIFANKAVDVPVLA